MVAVSMLLSWVGVGARIGDAGGIQGTDCDESHFFVHGAFI
jgi:hypothetical protein